MANYRTEKTISVIGAGHVGACTAAVFAAAGFKTYLVENNAERLTNIKKGNAPFYEQGLDKLLAHGIRTGKLLPTNAYKSAIPKSDIVVSCVNTPDNPDGSSNLEYVFSAVEDALGYMKAGTIFLQKSTVPVGTGAKINSLFKKNHKAIAYVSNPEFLREGTAIRNTLWFDRVVVGHNDQNVIEPIFDLYKQIEDRRNHIAKLARIAPPEDPPVGEYIIATNIKSAELIKVASNSFLAIKISYANSIAKLADAAGADINEVMAAVGSDPRIGRSFLNAGRGYGGGCIPKDVSGLISSGLEYGAELDILHATQAMNASMPGYIVDKLQDYFDGSLSDKRVAVLGLAFKSGTSDVRRSPGIMIANLLAEAGAKTLVYDPKATGGAKPSLIPGVITAQDIESATSGANAILIATDWPEFTNYSLKKYSSLAAKDAILVDCMNKFDIQAVNNAALKYMGVGRGPDLAKSTPNLKPANTKVN